MDGIDPEAANIFIEILKLMDNAQSGEITINRTPPDMASPMTLTAKKEYTSLMGDVYSVAHWFEKIGDAPPDAKMHFLVMQREDGIMLYAMSAEISGMDATALKIDENAKQVIINRQEMAKLAIFTNQWLRTIKARFLDPNP
jgi:hypothetical protein